MGRWRRVGVGGLLLLLSVALGGCDPAGGWNPGSKAMRMWI